jgi:hypothetical protein
MFFEKGFVEEGEKNSTKSSSNWLPQKWVTNRFLGAKPLPKSNRRTLE